MSATEVLEESERVLSANSRSFRLASRFLPRDRRGDAALLYALCRHIDDVADESPDAEQARCLLTQLRLEVLQESQARPLIAEFLMLATRRDLKISYLLELISGVESDLDCVRIETDEELLRYCYRVAGTVGLMMSAIMGVDDETALPHAIDLGVAMQLTNICRDVLEDARMDRIYLPISRLKAAGIAPEELLDESADTKALACVVEDILDMAESYYRSADRGMAFIPWRSRLAIVVASRVYRAIGLRLRRRGSQVLQGRTVVPTPTKALWVMSALGTWCWLSSPLAPNGGHTPALHTALQGLPEASS